MYKSTQRGNNMSLNEHLGTFDEEQPRIMQNRYTPDVASYTQSVAENKEAKVQRVRNESALDQISKRNGPNIKVLKSKASASTLERPNSTECIRVYAETNIEGSDTTMAGKVKDLDRNHGRYHSQEFSVETAYAIPPKTQAMIVNNRQGVKSRPLSQIHRPSRKTRTKSRTGTGTIVNKTMTQELMKLESDKDITEDAKFDPNRKMLLNDALRRKFSEQQ